MSLWIIEENWEDADKVGGRFSVGYHGHDRKWIEEEEFKWVQDKSNADKTTVRFGDGYEKEMLTCHWLAWRNARDYCGDEFQGDGSKVEFWF